jgi:prepilin peptidase CpaA
MSQYTVLQFLPLVLVLLWAALQDVRFRMIRNTLTFPLLVAGIFQSFLAFHTVTPWMAFAGILVGLALSMIMFLLGAWGGGDLKLMAAVGAWVGPVGIVLVFAAAALVSLVIVLVQCAWQGRLTALFRNSAILAINLAHANDVGLDHVTETGRSSRSVDKPLPYAVPILAATVLVILWSRTGL